MENYTPDELIDMILDGSYYKIKQGETLVDELCGKIHKEAEENEIDEEPAPVKKSMDQLEDEVDEACPGDKIRSDGKGRGLGRGNQQGPIGKPVGEVEDEIKEAEENEIDEEPAPVKKSMDQLEDEITEAEKCPSGFYFCPIRKKCIPVPKGQGVRKGKGRNPTGVPEPRKGKGLNPVRQGRGQQKESVVVRIKETYHGLNEQEKSSYQKFFTSMLKKHKVTSPAQLTGDKKKKFFDDVDKGWKAKKESD